MVLNDLADSFCHSQKNAGLKGLTVSNCHVISQLFIKSHLVRANDVPRTHCKRDVSAIQ